MPKNPVFRQAYSYPDRLQPYREFTIIYHESYQSQQAFPYYYQNQIGGNATNAAGLPTIGAVSDTFGINYGFGGLGSPILANRLRVGPVSNCVDCKYEEFFLSSWPMGDPAQVVDKPTTTCVSADGAVITEEDACKPTKVRYADDPSNVYHSYMRDHTRFRVLHGGVDLHHLHHQHAHQWLGTPNSPDGDYLDSQSIGPGSAFTMDMVYGGSGNVNQTVGDSIFHCHFYPHFASGMWSLWRVHDVLELGTVLDDKGVPEVDAAGNRALPDPEIPQGSPIPALVPMPSIPMAPAPAPVRLAQGGGKQSPVEFQLRKQDGTVDPLCGSDGWCSSLFVDHTFNPVVGTHYHNPGYPFMIAGVPGSRAPHPPLDFAYAYNCPGQPQHGEICQREYFYEESSPVGLEPMALMDVAAADAKPRTKRYNLRPDREPAAACPCEPLDGGLPRQFIHRGPNEPGSDVEFLNPVEIATGNNTTSNPDVQPWASTDYSKAMVTANAGELPEDGTLIEKVGMGANARRFHATCEPKTGTCAPCLAAGNCDQVGVCVPPSSGGVPEPGWLPGPACRPFFILNGLPPVPGAPYADPCIQFSEAGGPPRGVLPKLQRYLAADVQFDAIFNRSGWHFPQQRILALWGDVFPTLSGEKAPEPLFFRVNTYDCVEYVQANLVPKLYELDDFQVRTPTDVLGQHIHLVKFDVTSSDGSANGWNYEDGTLAPDEVTERIHAINQAGGLLLHPSAPGDPAPPCPHHLTEPGPNPQDPDRWCLVAKQIPFFGSGPTQGSTQWLGSQATVQRWYDDPLLSTAGFCVEADGDVELAGGKPIECRLDSDTSLCGAGSTCDPSAGFCSNAPTTPCVASFDRHRYCPEIPGNQPICVPAHDRTMRTVFTHDHFSPSTHQQAGLYAGLVVEPKASQWKVNDPFSVPTVDGRTITYEAGYVFGGYDPASGRIFPGRRKDTPTGKALGKGGVEVFDGGPTSWQALIELPAGFPLRDELSFREFMFQIQDSTLMYQPFDGTRNANYIKPGERDGLSLGIRVCKGDPGQVCQTDAECGSNGPCGTWSLCTNDINQVCQKDTDCAGGGLCRTVGFCAYVGSCFDSGRYNPTTDRCLVKPVSSQNASFKTGCASGQTCAIDLAQAVPCVPDQTDQGGLAHYCKSKLPSGTDGTRSSIPDLAMTCNYVTGIPSTSWNLATIRGNASGLNVGQLIDFNNKGVEGITFQGASYNFSVNYRNEPFTPRMVFPRVCSNDSRRSCNADADCSGGGTCGGTPTLMPGFYGDLSYVYSSQRYCTPLFEVPCTSDGDCDAGESCQARITDVDPVVAKWLQQTPWVKPNDPFTPMTRAYPGDDVQYRTLVGAHINPHNFTIHGLNWLMEPSFVDSGWRNSEVMGISEHFAFLMRVPPSGEDTAAAAAASGHPWSDFLYKPGAAAIEQASGHWGLLRAYDEPQTDPASALPTLPQNPAPFPVATVCPPGVEPRTVHVVARSKTITYNPVQTVNNNVQQNLADSQGIVFFKVADLIDPRTGKACATDDPQALARCHVKPGARLEPLVLRMKAGECLEVMLHNGLIETVSADAPTTGGNGRAFTPVPYQNNGKTPSTISLDVGLHAQLVNRDVRADDGANVGFNPDQTAEPVTLVLPPGASELAPARCPRQPGAPPNTCTYRWYAGNYDPKSETYVPIEFGTANLSSSDPLNHYVHGAIGALVIEPKKTDPASLESTSTSQVVSYVDYKGDERAFREFVVLQQDDLALSSGTINAVNYRAGTLKNVTFYGSESECKNNNPASNRDVSVATSKEAWYRQNAPDATTCVPLNFVPGVAPNDGWTAENSVVTMFEACAGEEVRMRLAHPGGTNTNETFELYGHHFSEAPYMTLPPESTGDPNYCIGPLMHTEPRASSIIGTKNLCGSSYWLVDDPPLQSDGWLASLNEWKGSRMGQGPSNHFDLLTEAGGPFAVPGDYLFRAYPADHFNLGMWGILRVWAPDDPKKPAYLECIDPGLRPMMVSEAIRPDPAPSPGPEEGPEEALEAALEAVERNRQRAEERPDEFLPALAASLADLGVILGRTGRHDEAFDVTREAVAISEQLADEAGHFLPLLARSLNNLGAIMGRQGRPEEALEVSEHAAGIFEQLADERPGEYRPLLARSVYNLSRHLGELGRHEEAHRAAAEAVGLLRPFFLEDPHAFAAWMRSFAGNYLQQAEQAGQEPDRELLDPIQSVFDELAGEIHDG
ncbi:MAG: hypothetical protein D6696_19650 [Acidobacteria bacterium]|nr:MAG: hypothetical protein D6696_19650 [Acidobacteriota bacterium]